MKVCTTCRIERAKSEFSKHAGKKDGIRSQCKDCVREYRKANTVKISEYWREYYKENTEKISGRGREYRQENAEKCAAKGRSRRARKRNADGCNTASDIRMILEGQRGLCANCKTKLFKSGAKKYHVDHIIPLALGGSNWPSNLQCLCPPCNLSKGAKHPDEWAAQNGRLI